MPKIYSENEKEQIVTALKQAARDSICTTGVHKTTVEWLVKKAKIPKGTFYLFFPSKEMLFFDVFLDEHNAVQQEMLNALSFGGGKITQESFTQLLVQMYRRISDSFLYKLMTGGEMELVIRKLPAAVVGEHLAHDDFSMEQLFVHIPQAQGKDAPAYSAAFRGIFLLFLHKKEIGEAVFDRALELVISALTAQLFKEQDANEEKR